MTYTPPVQDMLFVMEQVTGLEHLPEHPDLGKLDAEMVASVLEPAAKLASEVLAPLNRVGDQKGATWNDGTVTTAPGWIDAYRAYRDGGWNAVPFSPDHGGQGLPWLVAFAVQEMWQGANMSFGLCPLLNQGAVEAIEAHGSDAQKDYYLEKLISGEWTGTMNLTEPQAGSDLAAVRSRAERNDDGTYKIFGQKIFITYGEHDLAENIIHLVLARLPDAPEGVKGISLFIVPKFLEDGSRNDVRCTGIEHKLGIHASPTCTMQFGDEGGAVGYLVGKEHEGIKYMFTMMNNARLSVGLQGVAIADASYQHALSYAKERVQGGGKEIVHHNDVKRMLLTMASQVEAGRALTYEAALSLDLARGGDAAAQARVDFLTPIVKAWCTDMACHVTLLGVQVYGGMGFIEETGAAQFYRDVRILPIYEGTNGIQAADLCFRKIARDGGAAAFRWIEKCREDVTGLSGDAGDDLAYTAQTLEEGLRALEQIIRWIVERAESAPDQISAVSHAALQAFGIISAGIMLARGAGAAQDGLATGQGDTDFYEAKIRHARFFADHILPQGLACARTVLKGADCVTAARF
jgi:alkylation response protein AidB-like acyl-CoA dehydrogenase